MSSYLARELEVATDAVRRASRFCRNVQQGITREVLEKQDRSPVTMADFGSQAVVCAALRSAFPDDPVIGEEDAAELRTEENAGLRGRIREELAAAGCEFDESELLAAIDHGNAESYSPRFWTIDPIDGTKGFLRGDQYAVALALVIDGCVELAVLGCPNLKGTADNDDRRGILFTAVRGHGSRAIPLHDDSSNNPATVHVTTTTDSRQARFCESLESRHSSHGHSAIVAEKLGITLPPCRLDSQAKYAAVARGEADIYLRLPTHAEYRERIWDHASGALIVEEAGGRVTDVTGKPLEFTHGSALAENRGVVVTNGHLHDQVIKAVQAAGVK